MFFLPNFRIFWSIACLGLSKLSLVPILFKHLSSWTLHLRCLSGLLR